MPVFRAPECLSELYRRLVATLEPLVREFEILLIEDDGQAMCWSTIQALHAKDERVCGVLFARNFGQHQGISAGLDRCSGDYAVVMDCDLQDPPEAIPGMLKQAVAEGQQAIFARGHARPWRSGSRFGSYLFYKALGAVSHIKLDPATCNFSLISRSVIDAIRRMRGRRGFYASRVAGTGFPIAFVDVPKQSRFAGSSGYTFFRRARLAVTNILAYSNVPLTYPIFIGLLISVSAALYAIFLIITYISVGQEPSGWTCAAVAAETFGGFVVFQLGVIGLYLSEVVDEVRRLPNYIVAEQLGLQEQIANWPRVSPEEAHERCG